MNLASENLKEAVQFFQYPHHNSVVYQFAMKTSLKNYKR